MPYVMSRFNRGFLVVFSIAVVLAIATTIYVPFSSPFQEAQRFLIENPKVVEVVGKVTSVRVPFIADASMSYYWGSSKGYASFNVEVSGQKGTSLGDVKLERDLGVWKVKEARLAAGGTIISLTDK